MGARALPRRHTLTAALLALAIAAPARAGLVDDWSFVPIPEIVTSPNEGNTYGMLAVFLFLDEQDQIRYMLAPDGTYNQTRGFMANFRFFAYPTPTRRYSVVLGKSTTKDENYEVEFSDKGLWDGRAFIYAAATYEQDSTERFYGFGNDSAEDDETNYTNEDLFAYATPGIWLLPYVNLHYRMGIRRYGQTRGQVDSLPYTGDFVFPGRQPDLATTLYWSHRAALVYDSRNDTDIPERGAYAALYGEFADRRLGSSTSYVKFGAEWRQFIPFRKGNPILALRALADYTSAPKDTPFWEMPSLGGRRTLRAYGSDRFIDFNRSLASAEVRTRVWTFRLFGVNAELELAPFLELGQVFEDITDSPVGDLHWASGLGFRGLVRPQIVAFVDVGYGAEGSAVFSGVNYPF